ncbi:ornithine carbamoyltransferase, partial [Shewanella sp. 0m-11]
MQHLLSIKDLSQQQLLDLLALAKNIKRNPAEYKHALEGKSVVMLFEKPSLRTRV